MPRTATDVPNPLKINHKSHSAFGSMIIRVSDTTIIMIPHTAPSAYNANRILFICMRKTQQSTAALSYHVFRRDFLISRRINKCRALASSDQLKARLKSSERVIINHAHLSKYLSLKAIFRHVRRLCESWTRVPACKCGTDSE
jgi:hypothetical protein